MSKSGTVGQDDYFPTQEHPQGTHSADDPHLPIPSSFLEVPDFMNVCQPPASEQEIDNALLLRKPFLIKGYGEPFLDDIVRAFRAIKNMTSYLEVGTFDRSNLAFVSSLLADDANLIGIDIQAEDRLDSMLHSAIKPDQTYHSVVGDSRLPETLERVKSILGGNHLDCIFIDGNHTAMGVMHDYVNFSPLVRDGGLILFHDAVWEGNDDYKGVYHALSEIDRFNPIFLVTGANTRCFRFKQVWSRIETWGGVGILRV